MAKLVWGEGPRFFDDGVDRGVLYLSEGAVPWNGLVSVDEKATGTVNTDYYFEGNRIAVTQETGDFEALITAYTYPDAFAEYNGYSERNIYQRFGFSYRTQFGSGYKLHLVYNALIHDSDRAWKTISASVDPSLFAWDILASAVPMPQARPAARITLEVNEETPVVTTIENTLYGTDGTDPRLPTPEELYEFYESHTRLRIIYNDDGTYTAIGPDDMIEILADGQFRLTAPSLFLDEQDIFIVSSS